MSETGNRTESLVLAEALASSASSKLASEIVILDMRDLVSYTDYLVICSARNDRQADSIIEEVHRTIKQEYGLLPVNPGPPTGSGWAVLDYLDCVFHVFTGEARSTYDLEELWFEAPRVAVASGEGEASDAPVG